MPPDRVTVIVLGRAELSAEALRAVASTEHLVAHERHLAATRHLAPPTVQAHAAALQPAALAMKAASMQGRVTVLVDAADADALAAELADAVPQTPVTLVGESR